MNSELPVTAFLIASYELKPCFFAVPTYDMILRKSSAPSLVLKQPGVTDSISAKTLEDMDKAILNFRRGEVSLKIDLSDF